MAEETEAILPDRGAEDLAAALAVRPRRGRSRSSSRPSPEDTFLAAETRKLEVELHHLKLSHFDKLLTVGLKLMTAAIGLAFAAAVGVLAWRAHTEHGVVIEAFSVPPDLAQRGYTGQAVARALLDKLAALQAATVTNRPADTYSNDWGGDIKIEIPETGVSIGELKRFLQEEFGDDTRISGEVMRTGTGLAITARAGVEQGQTFSGTDADFGRLMQRAAEAVYAQTQPYRYAVYLYSSGRKDEAITAYARLAASGASEDRGWAYGAWAQALVDRGDPRGAETKAQQAIDAAPRLWLGYSLFVQAATSLSHRGAWSDRNARYLQLIRDGRVIGVPEGQMPMLQAFEEAEVAGDRGDYGRAAAGMLAIPSNISEGSARLEYTALGAEFLAEGHDSPAVREIIRTRGLPPVNSASDIGGYVRAAEAFERGDWNSVIALAAPLQGGPRFFASRRLADAYIRSGRLAEAEAFVSSLPLDCDDCLLATADVAVAKQDWSRAEQWVSLAQQRMPSLPFAYARWGELLLARGQPDAAIGKLAQAHALGPRYADALTLWGEALMRKGEYGRAAAKFAAANGAAPHWGRNHLLWGEALMLSGRYAEARKQYETAGGLDLTVPERAALDVLLARTAKGPLHG